MDAAQALADLTEISSQLGEVVILDRDGSLLASTLRTEEATRRFAAEIGKLIDESDRVARARGLSELVQFEVSTLGGSVFAVRRNGRLIAASTRPDPTGGLVFYDLRHCLASIDGAGEEELFPGSAAEPSAAEPDAAAAPGAAEPAAAEPAASAGEGDRPTTGGELNGHDLDERSGTRKRADRPA